MKVNYQWIMRWEIVIFCINAKNWMNSQLNKIIIPEQWNVTCNGGFTFSSLLWTQNIFRICGSEHVLLLLSVTKRELSTYCWLRKQYSCFVCWYSIEKQSFIFILGRDLIYIEEDYDFNTLNNEEGAYRRQLSPL